MTMWLPDNSDAESSSWFPSSLLPHWCSFLPTLFSTGDSFTEAGDNMKEMVTGYIITLPSIQACSGA